MKIFFLTLFILPFLSFGGGDALAQTNSLTNQPIFSNDPEDLFFNSKYGSEYLKDYTFRVENSLTKSDRGEFQFRIIVDILRDYLHKFLIPISIILIAWGGVQLIASRGKEEVYNEKKQMILSVALGFAIILLSVVAVDSIFFGSEGEILHENDSVEFASRGFTELQGIFNYLLTFAVAVAVGFVIFASIRLIMAGSDNQEALSTFRKQILFASIGMVILVSAQKIIDLFTNNRGFYSEAGVGKTTRELAVPEITGTIAFLIDWINFILGVIGVIAVISLIWAGIRLMLNFGINDEATEEAKRIVVASIIGLILAFSAWTIMFFFIAP